MKLKLTAKHHETANIWSFRFEPEEPATWQAGQSIRLEIPRKTWGYNERRFTISSAPHENSLQITTRISDSEFKQDLSNLAIGDDINGYNIEGSLHWGDPDQPKLFIAGGTGIVLFRVALAQAYQDGQDPSVSLLYSTKDTPPLFEQELHHWQTIHQNLRIHINPKRLTAKDILGAAPQIHRNLIHIAGPQTMVNDLHKQLRTAGLADTQLRSHFLQ